MCSQFNLRLFGPDTVSDIYPQSAEELRETSEVADNAVSYIYREREKASVVPGKSTRTVIIRQGTVFHTG